ncbi:MAG: cell wall metabolism sensor histidine kinase WalK [Clostridiales bacterium]|nr:cell wall metabolism sensor histidine kinase WalK [Clostridiales bacterium]
MNGTLKGKVSLVFFGLVGLIAIVGITASWNLLGLSRAVDGLMVANYKSINGATNMLDALDMQDSAIIVYINEDSDKGLILFNESNALFLKWFEVNAGNVTEPGEQQVVDDIKASYDSYMSNFLELQSLVASGDKTKSTAFYYSDLIPDFTKTKAGLKQLILLNEKSMFKSQAQATENSRNAMYLVFGLSLAAIAVGFFLSRFYTNKFLLPIFSLTKTMRLVKAGDLNQQADIISGDEIGELAGEFNNMTKRLQQFEKSTLGSLLSEKNKSLAIVRSISDPLLVLDTDYKAILLNSACEKLFMVQEDSVLNRHFLEGINNRELFDFISDTCEADEKSRHRIFNINSGAESFYYNVSVATVRDSDLKSSGIIVVFQNVTQLKELEKIRTDFIGTISHEIKTPLTSIIMGTDMLLDPAVGSLNEEQAQFISLIREDSDRLTKLVNELLELTRIESGKAVYKFDNYPLEEIILYSLKNFSNLFEQNGIKLTNNFSSSLPVVYADFGKVIRVINNLISNAIKYAGEGGEITVSAWQENGRAYVSVRDSGEGIPSEYLEKVFEKFFQVREGDIEIRGTGLGLAVAKEIIEAHNGSIWCESEIEAGSCFTFTLDIADDNGRTGGIS